MGLLGRSPRLQKSRANQAVSEETVATYRAAKAFLVAEWFGALLMNASYAQFSAVLARNGQQLHRLRQGNATADAVAAATTGFDRAAAWSLGVGLALLAIGGLIYWRSRTYYLRLDFPWKRRWEVAATVVAGAGAVFWLMVGLLLLLTSRGVQVVK